MKSFLLWLAEKIYKHYGRHEDIRLSNFIKIQGMYYQVHKIEISLKEARITAVIPEIKKPYKQNIF